MPASRNCAAEQIRKEGLAKKAHYYRSVP